VRAIAAGLPLDEVVTLISPGPTAQVAVADVDRDGIADVIATSASPVMVSVFRGTGQARFAPRLDLALPGVPRALAVADVTGDGHPDLVVACLSQWVSVFAGRGDATFAARIDRTVGSGPAALALGDVTGDGRTDLLAAVELQSQVSILPADGVGGFGARRGYPVAGSPDGLVVDDLDADGRADVAVTAPAVDELTVLRGMPEGRLEYWSSLSVSADVRAIAGARLDADGAPDLVLADASAGALTVIRGDGAAGFASSSASRRWRASRRSRWRTWTRTAGSTPWSRARPPVCSPCTWAMVTAASGRDGLRAGRPARAVATGDLNGDGHTDVAVALGGVAGVALRIATSTRISLFTFPNPSHFGDPVMLQASVSPPTRAAT